MGEAQCVMEKRPEMGPRDLAVLGSTTAVCVVGGTLLGLLVDRLAGTLPVFLFVGLGLGMLSAGLLMYARIRSYLG